MKNILYKERRDSEWEIEYIYILYYTLYDSPLELSLELTKYHA